MSANTSYISAEMFLRLVAADILRRQSYLLRPNRFNATLFYNLALKTIPVTRFNPRALARVDSR